MSATRDQDQKISFLFSNLYSTYRKGKEAAQNADVSSSSESVGSAAVESANDSDKAGLAGYIRSGGVLKAAQVTRKSEGSQDTTSEGTLPGLKVSSFEPASLLAKRLPAPENAPGSVLQATSAPTVQVTLASEEQRRSLRELRASLGQLDELTRRMSVLLQDIEEFTGAKKRSE